MIDRYTTLYQATGGAIQHNKSYSYGWQWVVEKGVLEIKQLQINL